MPGLIGRYMKTTNVANRPQPEEVKEKLTVLDPKEEIVMLKKEIDELQIGLRYMLGGAATDMSLNELQSLEKQLEVWIYHIRNAKMDGMFKEIQFLRNKEGMLTAANEYLHDKEDAEIIDFSPMFANSPFPLTIENETFQIQEQGCFRI